MQPSMLVLSEYSDEANGMCSASIRYSIGIFLHIIAVV